MNGNRAIDPQLRPDLIVELGSATPPVVMHRLAEVRRVTGVPRRVLAARLGISLPELRTWEESADVPISTLCHWAAVLNVPVTELVVEPEEYLAPTRLPASHAARLMRVAAKLRDRSRQRSIRRLAQTFVEQLAEISPELEPIAQKNHRHLGRPNRQPRASGPCRLSEHIFMQRSEPDECP